MIVENLNNPELYTSLVAIGLWAFAFSSSVRKEVYRRQKGKCGLCGGHQPKLETHHVVPHCIGGTDDEDNALGVDHECHKYLDNMALHHHIFYPDAKIIWEQLEDGEIDKDEKKDI